MDIIHLTKDNFDEVTGGDEKVLVDFWATWCGPCKMVGPILEEIASEDPAFRIGKVDVDEQPELAQKFMIRSVPTMMVFQNGDVIAQTLGAQPKASILKFVEEA